MTRARSTGMTRGGAASGRHPLGQEGAHLLDLVLLDVDQEHVGPALFELDRELVQQVGLQRADAEHEERAEPDGQQDDARLVARALQAEHRVPQREDARA